MKINNKEIRLAKYNPRSMNKETMEALKSSMEEFEDISGIVINSNTGNIVAGNHRWDILSRKYKDLNLIPITESHYTINDSSNKFTGFIAKVVDWDIKKEKAANVTANNDLLSGSFTSDLQSILDDVAETYKDELFEDLRLDELQIDLSGLNDGWGEDQLSKVQDEAEKRNRELEDSKTEEAANVKEIISVIKVSVPSEMKDDIKNDLLEFLASKVYYNEINIV